MWKAVLWYGVYLSNGMVAVNPGPDVPQRFATEQECRAFMLKNVVSYGLAPSGVTYNFRCLEA